MRYLRLKVLGLAVVASCFFLGFTFLGCTTKTKAAPQVNAYTRLQMIPQADPAKFANVHDYKSWRNPYLMVRKDGVSLFDVSNNEEHLLKLGELPDALARLSPSAWPYGRVAAVSEEKPGAGGDDTLIRKNRGIVAGTLEGLNILINWVPAS